MSVLKSVIANGMTAGGQSADVIARGLEAIRTHLGMSVAYVSEFVGDQSVFRAVDAPGLEALIKAGDARPLDDVFCRHILSGKLPELMPDVSREAFAMTLPIMQQVPIGAHMSVPIRKADGETYGMFCCLSFEANPSLNDRDLKMMRVFAEMTAHQIAQDLEQAKVLEDKRAQIRAIIETGAFRPVYQPIFDFYSPFPIGFECLCRFNGEPYRSPDRYFADAAECGLGIALEIAVMDKALRSGASLPAGVSISVNASPELIMSNRLPEILAGFSGLSVVVEVTEHAQVDDYDALRAALQPLRDMGIQLAVDDAGSGYSSLQHIIQLRPDIIKLDIGLIRAVDADPARRALIAALIYFARETGCLITAEGIETESERDSLRMLGVSKGQGYLLGRPMEIMHAMRLFGDTQAA